MDDFAGLERSDETAGPQVHYNANYRQPKPNEASPRGYRAHLLGFARLAEAEKIELTGIVRGPGQRARRSLVRVNTSDWSGKVNQRA